MRSLKYLLLAIVGSSLITAIMVRSWFPKVEIKTEYHQRQIDENTTAIRAENVSLRQAIRKLEEQNSTIAQEARRDRHQIASLTGVNARLILERDSALNADPVYVFEESATGLCQIPDTTIRWSDTFTNSLFRVDGTLEIRDRRLYPSTSLHQLREIDIAVATTLSRDYDEVRVYVTSRDFAEVRLESITSLSSAKSWWPFVAGSRWSANVYLDGNLNTRNGLNLGGVGEVGVGRFAVYGAVYIDPVTTEESRVIGGRIRVVGF